jgi:hypothetical protein
VRLAAAVFAASVILSAQESSTEPPQPIQNFGGWYVYDGDHPITAAWGIHLEGQYRRYDVITKWNQLLLRAAALYTINQHLRIAGGYTYMRDYAFAPNPAPGYNQHSTYEDALIRHPLSWSEWSQRFRLEQRFIALRVPGPQEWTYSNRFRYLLGTQIPIHKKPSGQRKLYIALSDEVFVDFGANATQAFDQNRAYAALGIRLAETVSLQVGYMFQYFPQPDGFDQFNHILHITLVSKTPFRHQKANKVRK